MSTVRKLNTGTQEEIRRRIVSEYISGAKPKDLSIKYGVHTNSIPRMVRMYKFRKTTARKKGSGRPKILTKEQKIKIRAALAKNPRISLQEMKNIASATCTIQTIWNYLVNTGLKSYKVYKKPELTFIHKLARFNWAVANRSRDWSSVVFSDEASFWLHEITGRMWVRKRSEARLPCPTHARKIHVWAGITIHGPIGLCIFDGILTAQRYIEILEDHLLDGADEALGVGQWVFQQDNDPKHNARISKSWLLVNVPELLEWPSRSPDLNPIENLWGYLKIKVRKRGPTDINSLITIIEEEFRAIPIEFYHNIFESMNRRIDQVIERHGECTDY
jgi:transposase